MRNNVFDLTGQPYQPDPTPLAMAAPEPHTMRIRVNCPEPAPAPALTPLGALVAVLVGLATFVLVRAVLG